MTTATIRLYGTFGTEEGQISHQGVLDQLALIGSVDVLEVRIASKGGDAWEGMGVYNALKDFPAKKIVYIDSYAMSVASWVAMVGEEIHIPAMGILMYHEGKLKPPHSTEDELLKHAGTLKQMNELMADAYSARTGIPREQIIAEMKATTWLKAEDAIRRGFATKLIPNYSVVAEADLSDLENVPDWVQAELQAGVTNQVEESPMPDPVVEAVVAPVVETPPPAAPAVVSPVANVVDLPTFVETARLKERKRVRDVTAACQMAGCDAAVINEFIDKDYEVEDVRNHLFAQVCANRKPIGESGAAPAEKVVNHFDSQVEAEYEANKVMITNMGVSKEQYILSKKKTAETK